MISERQIVIALVTSTDYHIEMKDKWQVSLLESSSAKRIAQWCKEYFDTYNKAPGRAIEPIFYDKAKNGLSKDVAEDIEDDILPSLSREYEETPINVEYLVEQSKIFFKSRSLLRHADEVKALVETNKLLEAENKASSFTPFAPNMSNWIDLSDESVYEKVKQAFEKSSECLIHFYGALGEMWNPVMIRGGFVSLFGPEKRGKTFWLLTLALRACKQGRKVAFWQAGDMSESEQLLRISIALAGKSNKEEYCKKSVQPVKDCVKNQNNTCVRKCREVNFGIFEGKTEKYLRDEVRLDDLKKARLENPEYRPCRNCADFDDSDWGCTYIKTVDECEPLTHYEANKLISELFVKYKRQFRIATYPTGTLTMHECDVQSDIWEKQDGFVADVNLWDYPDIMEDPVNEFRHKQNEIWKKMRGFTQKRKTLGICVTQSDADSYKQFILNLKNFSEDKRKFGHVTAFYGLNQDPSGREKELGIMRINEIVIREGTYNTNKPVHVLQNLKRGKAYITSYW